MTLDTVRRTFTAWAPFYDATHAWPLPLRREARLALGVQRGDRVLDVACGTGLNFSHLRELVGEEGYVLGVDATPAMLDIARQRIARRGRKNVEVREVDAAQLPFLDASFDKAICTFALSIIPDYVRAIEEARRVLVPGGRFVSLEMRPSLHNVPGWLKPLASICAVDMSHRTLNELRRAFTDVQVHKYWKGFFFIAVAKKG
jgi:ubiquinone/menaquinone biosynthesis C-methylase UbiE